MVARGRIHHDMSPTLLVFLSTRILVLKAIVVHYVVRVGVTRLIWHEAAPSLADLSGGTLKFPQSSSYINGEVMFDCVRRKLADVLATNRFVRGRYSARQSLRLLSLGWTISWLKDLLNTNFVTYCRT